MLLELFVVLVAARLASEVAERVGQPGVLAEIAVGMLIGPSALGLVHGGESLEVIGEIGAILLLFEVGREMDFRELRRVGGASLRVATIGVVVPMTLGVIAMRLGGIEGGAAVFIGAGITATSVGITARVFGDLRALATAEARVVLGAAVVDDIMGLLILAVVSKTAAGSSLDAGSIVALVVTAVGFVVLAGALGGRLVPRFLDGLASRARTDGTMTAIGLAVALGFAWASQSAKLAPIVGAFVAGLAVGRSEAAEDLHRRLTPIGDVFIPVFFVGIGVHADLGVFTDGAVLGLAGILTVVAIIGKLVSGVGVGRAGARKMIVGAGMIPRGEVGLIFAGLGLSSGVLDARTYGVLVAVVMATTVVAPPWLRALIRRAHRVERDTAAEEVRPVGGWLRLERGEVDLAAAPPDAELPAIAMRAALLCEHARPGGRLVERLTAYEGPVAWNDDARDALRAMLREGSGRAWRTLEMSGMFAKLFPDLAAALRRRERDPFDLEPGGPLLSTLDPLRRAAGSDDGVRAVWEDIRCHDDVLFAALARGAVAGAKAPAAIAEGEAARVGLADPALVGALVAERHLLPAAAARPDGSSEDNVLDLAAHIGTKEIARALHVLAVAEGGWERWERERLDQLFALIVEALEHPELTGARAQDLVEAKRVAVAGALRAQQGDVDAALRAAPRRYVLTQPPAAIARHIKMTEGRLGRDEVRLEAEPARPGAWTVHVVAQDRVGLLASIARAFAEAGVAVERAAVATWATGVAVDVFVVESDVRTDWDEVRRRIEHGLDARVTSVEPVEGDVSVDDRASPWHSIVEVRATDRVGLLGRVAAALASAGLRIHHASVLTVDGVAVDTFAVTDRTGSKLGIEGERRLRAALAGRARNGARILAAVTRTGRQRG